MLYYFLLISHYLYVSVFLLNILILSFITLLCLVRLNSYCLCSFPIILIVCSALNYIIFLGKRLLSVDKDWYVYAYVFSCIVHCHNMQCAVHIIYKPSSKCLDSVSGWNIFRHETDHPLLLLHICTYHSPSLPALSSLLVGFFFYCRITFSWWFHLIHCELVRDRDEWCLLYF